MKKGPYEVIQSKTVYKNPWIEVKEELVINPDGTDGLFGIVDHGSGVGVLPIDKDKNVYLIKEYYYALEKVGIQIPCGGIDKNEDQLTAAKRELKEETGIIADKYQYVGYLDPLTTAVKCPMFVFFATNLHFTEKLERNIELLKVPFDKALQMVMDNTITHGHTCFALMKSKILLDTGKLVI